MKKFRIINFCKVDGSGKRQAASAATEEKHVRFYTGSSCSGNIPPMRADYFAVSTEQYPSPTYPFFCLGPINIFSMKTVHDLAVQCPHHCTAQDRNEFEENRTKYCLSWIDDVFIGSCVAITQQNLTKTLILEPRWGEFMNDLNSNERNASNDLAVHGNKTPSQMLNTHKYYNRQNLVF